MVDEGERVAGSIEGMVGTTSGGDVVDATPGRLARPVGGNGAAKT